MPLVIDVPFVKLEDDETCALLKPMDPKHYNSPSVDEVVKEIMRVFSVSPEVKKRVALKLATEN